MSALNLRFCATRHCTTTKACSVIVRCFVIFTIFTHIFLPLQEVANRRHITNWFPLLFIVTFKTANQKMSPVFHHSKQTICSPNSHVSFQSVLGQDSEPLPCSLTASHSEYERQLNALNANAYHFSFKSDSAKMIKLYLAVALFSRAYYLCLAPEEMLQKQFPFCSETMEFTWY